MKTCQKCGKEFKTCVKLDGKKRILSGRKFCLECSPFGRHNTRDITKNIIWEPNRALRVARRYQERMLMVKDALGGKCSQCDGVDDLEIDHIDPKTKSGCVSTMLLWRLEKLMEEVAKCQLLCERCHRIKTALESGKTPSGILGIHGTLTGKQKMKCSCPACRKVQSDYMREYRRKKRVSPALAISAQQFIG